MRVLVASDIHGSDRAVKRMIDLVIQTNADLVTISGDITHFGQSDTVDLLMNEVPVEILGVTGNCDPLEVSFSLERSRKVTPMNGNIVRRMGWNFCGYSYQDRTIQEVLPLVPRELLILLTHVPARGILDSTRVGHIGDGNINEWVDENRPAAVLSGHVHEARGFERHEDTLFLNPGPARDNLFALLEMGKDKVLDITLL